MVRALSGDDAGASGKMGMRPPGRESAIIMAWSSREQKSRRINLGGLQMPNISFAWVKQRSPWRRGQIICSSRGALYQRAMCWRVGEEKHHLCEFIPAMSADRFTIQWNRDGRLVLSFTISRAILAGVTQHGAKCTKRQSSFPSWPFFSSRISGSLDDFLARMFAEPPHRSVAFHANSRTETCLTMARRWQVSCKYRLL